jgi:hypothetical protein
MLCASAESSLVWWPKSDLLLSLALWFSSQNSDNKEHDPLISIVTCVSYVLLQISSFCDLSIAYRSLPLPLFSFFTACSVFARANGTCSKFRPPPNPCGTGAQSLRPCWVAFFEKELLFYSAKGNLCEVAPVTFIFMKADNVYRVCTYIINIMDLLNVIHGSLVSLGAISSCCWVVLVLPAIPRRSECMAVRSECSLQAQAHE